MPLDRGNIGFNKPTNEPEDLTSSLRRRIDLQMHEDVGSWTTVASDVPASISPTKGFPLIAGGPDVLDYPVQYAEIRVRYRPGQAIYPRMRVRYEVQGRVRLFEVAAVSVPDEYRRSVVMTCRELVDVGPVK